MTYSVLTKRLFPTLLLLTILPLPPAGSVSDLSRYDAEPLYLLDLTNGSAVLPIEIPRNATVLSASIGITAAPVTAHRNITYGPAWNGTTLSNLSVEDGTLRLNRTSRERAMEGFSGWSLDNATLTENGSLELWRSGREEFLPSAGFSTKSYWQYGPRLAAAPSGRILLVWEELVRPPGIFDIYATYSDDGATFAAPFRVDDGPASTEQKSPAVAADGKGGVHVAWVDNRNGYDGAFYSYSSDGASFSPSVDVGGPGARGVRSPSVTIAPDGTVHIVWADNRSGPLRLYHSSAPAGSRTFTPPNPVEPGLAPQAGQWQPALAAAPDSSLHLVWYDNRSGEDRIYHSRSSDGGATWSAGARVSAESVVETSPAMAVQPAGGGYTLHLAWQLYQPWGIDLMYANSSDGGATFTAPQRVADTPDGAYIDHKGPSLALSGASLYIAWFDDRNGDDSIYYTMRSGGAFLSSIGVDDGGDGTRQRYPSLVLSPAGRLHAAWEDNRTGGVVRVRCAGSYFPYFSAGTAASDTVDLGEEPADGRALPAGSWDGQVTSAALRVRTSPDGSAWSAWGDAASTPIRRFIRMRADLSTSDRQWTPRLEGVALSWTSYATGGTASGTADFGAWEASAVLATPIVTGGGEASFSLLCGGAWFQMLPGRELPLPLMCADARWQAALRGTTNSTPLVRSLPLAFTVRSLPSEVRFSIGNDPVWEPGTVPEGLYPAASPDMAKPLNRYLARSGGAGGTVTVPLTVTSLTPGVVAVRYVALTVNRAPAIVSSGPAGDVRAVEGGAGTFAVAASDPDGDALTVTWALDGVPLRRGGDAALTLDWDFASSGEHTVAATVSDGLLTVNRTWRVSVDDVNRPPALAQHPRASSVDMEEGARSVLAVEATDPDGDALRYRWSVDGLPVNGNWPVFGFEAGYLSAGKRTVRVEVSDGNATLTASWNVRITPVKPATPQQRETPPPAGPVLWPWLAGAVAVGGVAVAVVRRRNR